MEACNGPTPLDLRHGLFTTRPGATPTCSAPSPVPRAAPRAPCLPAQPVRLLASLGGRGARRNRREDLGTSYQRAIAARSAGRRSSECAKVSTPWVHAFRSRPAEQAPFCSRADHAAPAHHRSSPFPLPAPLSGGLLSMPAEVAPLGATRGAGLRRDRLSGRSGPARGAAPSEYAPSAWRGPAGVRSAAAICTDLHNET